MRALLALAATVALTGTLAGCLGTEKAPEPPPPPPVDLTREDCFTVVMFSDASIERPGADVPEAWNQYLGIWVKGAWDGKWCHDLYVTKIEPTGAVEVIEAHGPYEPWAKPATAFRRTGQIGEDGKLRVTYGTVQVTYEILDGKLVASRREGRSSLAAALTRQS